MRHTTNTTPAPLLSTVAEHVADFVLGVAAPLLGLGGLVALFVGPLWILARTLGVC